MEADLLRSVTSGGVATKVVALGIGISISDDELRGMASPPQNRTVIRVPNFTSLPTVEVQLRGETTCRGKNTSHSPSCYLSAYQTISRCFRDNSGYFNSPAAHRE